MAVARVTEIISGSKKSFQDAIEKGIARANKTLKNVEGAWIQDQTVVLDKGEIKEYRVAMHWRPEPLSVEKLSDDLCLGVKGQSNLLIAGSPRNLFR